MRGYTVHAAAGTPGGAEIENAVFVSERFAPAAFVFGPLWLLYHRLWPALAGMLAALAVLAGLSYFLALSPPAGPLLSLLLHGLLGLEAHNLRRQGLERSGRPALAVVYARNEEEAEVRFFSAQMRAPQVAAPATAAPARTDAAAGVIGGFSFSGDRG